MKFSIIVPTYNRPVALSNCLEALTRLNYPNILFEVIVVDDGGNTNLDSITASFIEHLNLKTVRQANTGPATARNKGASIAKGRYLVFTDDDCQPSSDWLQSMERRFIQFPQSVLTGKTINALPDNTFSTASQLLIDYLYSYYNTDYHQARFFTSNNLALPADLFRNLNGFDASFPNAAGEDRELCYRMVHDGQQIIYVSGMNVYHKHDLTLRTFWQQHFCYGNAAYRFHQILSERIQAIVPIEPVSFYLRLLLFPLRNGMQKRPISIFMLMVLSQVANMAGFFWNKYRTNQLAEKQ